MRSVGWIGLGAMGLPMAHALMDKGFSLTVYDLDPKRMAPLAARGAQVVERMEGRPFSRVEVLGIVLQNYSQCYQVLVEQGGLEQLAPGTYVVIFSTIGPQAMQSLEALAAIHQVEIVDAPISGGPGRARGHLSIMASGRPDAILALRPLLNALADTVTVVGDQTGQGQAVKMINQLLAGVHIVAAAEALTLARKVGVDPELAYRVIRESAGNSWMFSDRGPRMLSEEYMPVHSALNIFVKDLGIVQDAARASGMPLFLAPIAYQLFLGGASEGLDRFDDAAVIEVYKRLAGIAEPCP